MTETWRTTCRRGVSLLEAILAIAVFGILAAGSMYLVAGPLSSANTAIDRQRALFLAEEGIEAARAIQDDRWTGLTLGDHGLTDLSGRWQFSGSQDVSADGYTRVVTVEAVERDSGGDIVLSGGNVDRRTRRVVSTVSWERFGISREVSTVAYLTDWDTYDWRHTTDSDFLPGEKSYTRVVGSGESASVQLAPSAEKLWDPSEGSLIIHTTDADWSPGTYTDTELVGTGIPASISETGPQRWIEVRSGKSIYHTTDVDFAGGTFDDTALVDTGDLGAVSLDTGEGWAVYIPPPVNDHLNAVDMDSATDGWAVGEGGVIVRWDGAQWYEFVSPTSRELNDIDVVSANEAYAVGANGTAIRWNGTAWSTVTAATGTYYSVSMVSSTDGWAVGASGKIWRWDGVSWSEFTTTNKKDTWYAVEMVSATDGWAVGSQGKIVRWNGVSWSPVTSPTNSTLNGISCANASFCAAIGSQGEIIHWNGVSWALQSSPVGSALFDISLSSTTDGWAVGTGGTLIHWNGSFWSSAPSPTGAQLNGVVALSASDVFAVGNVGEIIQYGTNYLSSGYYYSPIIDAGQSVDWGHAYWDEIVPDLTDLSLAFRSGNTPTPDGSWSAWDGEYDDPFNTDIPSPDGRYLQYRLTLTTDNPFVAPRLNSIAVYYDEPDTASFFDIKVTVPNSDGWAVGQNGAISRMNGYEWSSWSPSPTGETLFDLDFSDENNVYAVGYNGTIINWDGVSWSLDNSPTGKHLYGVDILPDGTGWAVGRQGEIVELRSNGMWRIVASPVSKDLNAVSLSGPDDGWAVGNNGTVVRWDGNDWTVWPAPTSQPINGVYAVSPTFAVMVAQGGEIYMWDGVSWNSVVSTTPNELNDVFCAATDDCWAVGIQQTFLQWDGVAWSQYFFDNPSNPVLQGVHLPPGGDGWVTGEGAALFRYTAYHMPQAYYHGPVVDSGESGMVWNTISWNSIQPLFTGITMAVRTGETPTPDGSWSAWTVEYSDKGGSTITAPTGRYLQYRVTFFTSDNAATAVLEEIRLIRGAVTAQDLYDTDGTLVSDVWAVGRAGTIVHYDGIEWSLVSSPTVRSLRGVAAVSQTDAWAVGAQGTIIHWDGLVWTNYTPSPTAEDLLAISAVSASDVWAVGNQGTIIHWDGFSWSAVSSPTTVKLRGVHLPTASVGYAVGDGGAILEWDGASWTSYSSPVAVNLNAVFLVTTGTGWAVGDSGTVIKWDGVSWTVDTQPLAVRLNAIEARTANEAWIAGDFGAILEWDGVSWETFTSPTTRHLYGITVYAPTDGWICGAKGVLLKDPEQYPSAGTFMSTVLDTDSLGQALTVYWWQTNPAGTDVSVALRSGDTPTPDGTWSAWSSELSDENGASVSLPSARYFQYRLTLTTSDSALTPSLDEILVTYTLQ